MKKILILLVSVFLVGAATLSANGQGEAGGSKINLRVSIADSESSVFYAGMAAFKDYLESESAGEVSVTIYPSGQLGNLREVVEGLQMGTIDVTVANSSVVSNFCSDVAVFDLPFLFDSNEHAYNSLDGEVGETLNSQLAEKKLKVLGWWPIGFRNVTLNEAVSDVEELSGKRIRIMDSQVFRETFKALGVDPVPLNFSELYTALQQGTVDGQENPFVTILDAKICEVNKFILETGHTFSPAAMMISEKTWNKLTDDQKSMFTEAGKVATAACRDAYEMKTEAAKTDMVENYGVTIISPDKGAMREMTKSVYDNYPNLSSLVEIIKSLR